MIYLEYVFVDFTNNYKEMASNIQLNMKMWFRKTEIAFSCNKWAKNLLVFSFLLC